MKVSDKAPNFTMPALRGKEFGEVKLEDFKGKWLVMFFYPLDFTFVCPTEITAFRDAYEQFKALNAEVLAISVDSIYSHDAWTRDIGELPFPWGSDIKKKVSQDYNVLLEQEGISLRGLFVIDPEGVVRYHLVHELGVGRSVDETLRVLGALQTGELCPANWKPGEDTLGQG